LVDKNKMVDHLPLNTVDSFRLILTGIQSGRHLPLSVLPNYVQCCHASHTWNARCLDSSVRLFIGSLKRCLRVYGSLYFASALIRRRPPKYFLSKLPREILQSSVFLAANCFYFLGFFCLSRKFFGNINYWGTFLFNIPACFLSIILERKQRRGLLALYLTNLAAETAFNMLVYRGKASFIPNGEVLIFALTSAVYALLFKMKNLDGSLASLIRTLIGPDTVTCEKSQMQTDNHFIKLTRQSRIIKYLNVMTNSLNNFSSNKTNGFTIAMRFIEKKLEALINSLNRSFHRHQLCSHRYNCITHSLIGFFQRFIAGYLIQATFKCLGSFVAILKNPKFLVKLLKSPVNTELGLFLGFYVFAFRAISCALRWFTNQNDKFHALIAGFFSGWSMIFYKSSTIALYLNFKLLETLWFIGVKNKQLPLIKSFDIILYTLSTAFVLWVGLYEPHNIRSAYWKFLVNVSDNKFALVNRHIFDAFGTDASSIDRKKIFIK